MSRSARASLDASIVVPFIIFTLVWSSTWLVIRGQLGLVAPQWSVAYRFLIAALGMALVARLAGHELRPTRPMLVAALVLGVSQFSLNFNSVYLAERFITSGVVATVFAILVVPNSLLAWAWLGHRPSLRFIAGGALAAAGAALLFANELSLSKATPGEVAVGLGFTLAALMGASVSNVYQARPHVARFPLYALLAWSMALGALLDCLVALAVAGPPAFDPRPSYWIGLLYLALAASVLCFSLYYPVVRRIGPGKAAYSSVMVPIIAMALSTAFEDYRWSVPAVTGAAMTLTGMLIALTGRSRREPEPIAAPDAA